MKRLIVFLMALICAGPMVAQNVLNDKAVSDRSGANAHPDNIVGTYSGKQGDDRFKVKIVKLTDGTYRGQVIWMERDKDAKGNKILDSKNPDKSLRSKPADQAVLFSGLKYDSKKHCWNDTKIYDPQRGLKASMTAEFVADGRLRIKGTVLGIGETVFWNRE